MLQGFGGSAEVVEGGGEVVPWTVDSRFDGDRLAIATGGIAQIAGLEEVVAEPLPAVGGVGLEIDRGESEVSLRVIDLEGVAQTEDF